MMTKKNVKVRKAETKSGRPSKYRPEFIKIMEDFFDVEPFTIVKDKDGREKMKLNQLPYMVDFNKKIGVARQTVYAWLDENSDQYQENFSVTYKRVVKQMREKILSSAAYNDLAPQPISIFLLKAWCGLSDGSNRVEITGKDGGSIKSTTEVMIAGIPKSDDEDG
jgi:hypothetical protein